MSDYDRLPADITARLGANRDRGDTARASLVRRLAKMSLAELRQVSTMTWARLGTEGLVELVRQSKLLAHLDLRPQDKKAVAPRHDETKSIGARVAAQLSHWRNVRPLWWVILVSAMLWGAMASALVLASPALESVVREVAMDGRPAECPRLDKWVRGCVYTVRSEATALAHLAERLGLPGEDLAEANRPLASLPNLSRGTRIVVPPRRFNLFRWSHV